MLRIGVVVIAALVAAGGGHAAIVPQQGIGGARLGMTQQAVKAALGAPSAVRRGSNEIGSYVTFTYPSLQVTFFGGPNATSIVTRSARQRTADGVGVGSTVAEVTTSVPGVKCVKESGYHHCFVGTWQPGHKISDFSIALGRVTRVTVGYVID